jgi:hypothetical protein
MAWNGELRHKKMVKSCESECWRAIIHLLVYKVKYIYRRIPQTTAVGPASIRLRDGDEIKFGEGPDGPRLGRGPSPILCNFHLAVARALNTSGAAELITQWKDEADDSDFPHVYLASEDFCRILDAQLLLSGQALIV